MNGDDMSRANFTIAYNGEALREGAMDVRDLAPALLAIGQLVDAANQALNADAAKVAVNVRATRPGCFVIDLEVAQSIFKQFVDIFSGNTVTAAVNLKEIIFWGGGGVVGLFQLIKLLRGKNPERIEKLEGDAVRITTDGTTFVVPLKLLRLYQDLSVRHAVDAVVRAPLSNPGIDKFSILDGGIEVFEVTDAEAVYFEEPDFEEEVVLEEPRRSAFSILSLAFKDGNKWRLHDGSSQISAIIADEEFLRKVNNNDISFSKGDILICDVMVRQSRNAQGLKTEYIVEKVIDHLRAPRQLTFNIEEPGEDEAAEVARIAPTKARASETEIGLATLRILADSNGTSDMPSIRASIPQYLELTEQDLAVSDTRQNEQIWMQQVRNLISHRNTGGNIFAEGYAIYDNGKLSITKHGIELLKQLGY